MWYFSWILGTGFAVALGVINALWLEDHFFRSVDTQDRQVERRTADRRRS